MYYSRTTTTEPSSKAQEDVKFESTETHQIIVVNWEHCYPDTTNIKVTKSPLKIEATSYDGLHYHSLELSLQLSKDITTLKGAFYKASKKGFRIHIPNENLKARDEEAESLPKAD